MTTARMGLWTILLALLAPTAATAATGAVPGRPLDRLQDRNAVGKTELSVLRTQDTLGTPGSITGLVSRLPYQTQAPVTGAAVNPFSNSQLDPRSSYSTTDTATDGRVRPAMATLPLSTVAGRSDVLDGKEQTVTAQAVGANRAIRINVLGHKSFDTGLTVKADTMLEIDGGSLPTDRDKRPVVVVGYVSPEGIPNVAVVRLSLTDGTFAIRTISLPYDFSETFKAIVDVPVTIANPTGTETLILAGTSASRNNYYPTPGGGAMPNAPGIKLYAVRDPGSGGALTRAWSDSDSYFYPCGTDTAGLYSYTSRVLDAPQILTLQVPQRPDNGAGYHAAFDAVYLGSSMGGLRQVRSRFNDQRRLVFDVNDGESNCALRETDHKVYETRWSNAGDLNSDGVEDLAAVELAAYGDACNLRPTVHVLTLNGGVMTNGAVNDQNILPRLDWSRTVFASERIGDRTLGDCVPWSGHVGIAAGGDLRAFDPNLDRCVDNDVDSCQPILPEGTKPFSAAGQVIVSQTISDPDDAGRHLILAHALRVRGTGNGDADLSQTAPTLLKLNGANAGFNVLPTQAGHLPMIAVGRPDGTYRIGEPQVSTSTRLKPRVILNSPPTHYDVVGGKTYDVNTCKFAAFVSGECESFSIYKKSDTNTGEVSVETTETWALDQTARANANLGPVAIEGEFRHSELGEDIRTDGTVSTTKVDLTAVAQDDDQIFADVEQYDILEYPILNTDPTKPLNYLAVVTPTVTDKRWMSASGPLARTYLNPHESGNLLSYPPGIEPQYNPQQATQDAKGNAFQAFGAANFELSRTSDFLHSVTTQTLTTQGVSKSYTEGYGGTATVSVEVGTPALGGGAGISVNGDYTEADLQTSTTTVQQDMEITAKLGRISPDIGNAGFLVRPFSYYSNDGALVIDYAVEPDRTSDGTDTFWTRVYGRKPNLTFTMPHRYDVERGIALPHTAQTNQTKDITATNGPCTDPDTSGRRDFPWAGDQMCLQAQVQNFSLSDQPSGSVVRFYLGDPAAGGQQIGQTTVGAVNQGPTNLERAAATAKVTWTVPSSVAGRFARIYAVVDPENRIAEVHDEDNSAWTTVPVFAKNRDTTAPLAPASTEARENADGSVSVSWELPAIVNQPAGTTYLVRAYPAVAGRPSGEVAHVAEVTTTSTALGATFGNTQLTPGETYIFGVFAVSGSRTSTVADRTEPVTFTRGVPSAPTGVTASPASGSVTVNWRPPAGDAGNPVSGYVVQADSPGEELCDQFGCTVVFGQQITRTVDASSTQLLIDGLINGRKYKFRVRAINAVGEGPWSTFSPEVVPAGVPRAPVAVNATGGPNSAQVTWTPPSDNGGYAVDRFRIRVSPGGRTVNVPSTDTSRQITGLHNGVSYTFDVAAENTKGFGPTEGSNPVTPMDVPTAARDVAAVAQPRALSVSWTEPATLNGAPVSGYKVLATAVADPADKTLVNAGPDARSATVGGLVNGRAYTVTVVARNAAGEAPAGSASGPATPRDVPSPSTGVAAERGTTPGTARVTWSAPGDDGGSPVTGYRVVASPGGGSASVAASERAATVSGLTLGATYTFRVIASSAAGAGTESAASNAVALVDAPSAPRDVTATAGARSAEVSWTEPASSGGAPVTGYTVRAVSGGEVRTATAAAADRSGTVSGLTNGRVYKLSVTARNGAGDGPAGAAAADVTPLEAPGAPTGVTATRGNGSATVNWVAPTDTGGSPVQAYEVTAQPGAIVRTVDAAATQAAFTGLANGTEYTFTVRARSAAGLWSAPSSPSSAVGPAGAPGVPSQPELRVGAGTGTVRWGAASPNGSAVTEYVVRLSPGGHVARLNGADRAAFFGGLVNGTSYTATVAAVNAVGEGPAASTGAAQLVAAPAAPRSIGATRQDRSALVKWTAPADDGGTPLTGYEVTASPGGARGTVGPQASETVVTGLTNGTAYTFTVRAVNGAGSSAESTPSEAVVPAAVPGVPGAVRAVPADGRAEVSWDAPVDSGGLPVRSYTVVAEPAGLRVTVDGATQQAVVRGLQNGVAQRFHVLARTDAGESAPSDASAEVTPVAPPIVDVSEEPIQIAVNVNATHPVGPINIGGTTYATKTVTLEFNAISQGGDVNCSVDGEAAFGCSSPLTLNNLTDGRHVVLITANNEAGQAKQTIEFVVDRTAPGRGLSAPDGLSLARKATQTLTATDEGAGLAGFDVTTETATSAGGFRAPVDTQLRTTRSPLKRTAALLPGTTTCTRIRAFDALGLLSSWTARRCVTAPVDDRTLKVARGEWRAVKRPGFRGTARRATRKGAALSLRVAAARKVAVLLRPCKPCGGLDVRFKGRKLRHIESSRKHTNRVKVQLPRPGTGKLRLELSSDKPVFVDGVGVIKRPGAGARKPAG